jgi:hypothetical protein
VAALRHATDEHSGNGGAGRVRWDGPVAAEVVERLLARARAAGGERGRDYLAERLAVLRDGWISRQQGEYPLGYTARRDPQQTYVALLDAAGDGPWQVLTVPRSMRETENEVNLLVSGGDLTESLVEAPVWSFTRPEPTGEPGGPGEPDEVTGDEFGEPAGGARRGTS